MDFELLGIRLRKLAMAIRHPRCWAALRLGVAPSAEHAAVLRHLDVDGVIDVGANRGQFTLVCRVVLPRVPVVAFEPIPHETALYRRVHGQDTQVTLVEAALGEARGEAVLHLSQSADSSSLLPIGRRQTELFRNTVEIGTINVPVETLDGMAAKWHGRNRQLLKLDVQGFELNVLRGSLKTLQTCGYVYVECSEVSLYDGQALRSEVEDFLAAAGFTRQDCCNRLLRGGELIQADYLFARTRSS